MGNAVARDSVVQERLGATLVFASAVVWSFGGAIGRYLAIEDSWTVVFWRSLFAGIFLVGFLLLRDGPRETLRLYRNMGVPGLMVAFGFATAASCFVIAISYTTVANVVLIQASVPLFAALMSWLIFRERISLTTWIAIAAVIAGVAIMVSGSLGQGSSWIGNALALAITLAFAVTTVVTRRYPDVRQTPGASVGCLVSALFAATQASSFDVSMGELGILFIFGAVNLGFGMALFVTGARLIPAAFAALLGTGETMLAPVWVAVLHGEVPAIETIVGGLIVLAALIGYLLTALGRKA